MTRLTPAIPAFLGSRLAVPPSILHAAIPPAMTLEWPGKVKLRVGRS